ncbi:MAG: RNA polymerase Rpb4 family protein [Thermofilaceae archaeon]
MKIIKEKLLTLPEVAEILLNESNKHELTSVEVLVLDYARKFKKMNSSNAVKLVKELREAGLPEEIAVQLANIAPESEDEIRTILAPSSRIFSSEDIKNILNKINEFRRDL